MTAHRFFKLPIFKDAKFDKHWPLSDAAVKILRQHTRNLKLILGDELSMFSNVRLAQMHLRLQEIFGNDILFGGINIVFFGDLLQVGKFFLIIYIKFSFLKQIFCIILTIFI